ncbi:DUF1877 family protein [Actinoplanes sp. G11-F43]|uniref:DUF1877 family protein n=1 Tax=Actinoplanes sp. G11-F43 TaxID=3424130 RepID=UPI003D32E22B
MSVISYYRRVGPAGLDELRRLSDDPIGALEYAGVLPGTHTDRAWAGLHFLLLDVAPPVDVINGGEPFAGHFRLLTAAEVTTAAAFLDATPFATLAAHYDRALMESIGVYPDDLWEADWALSYLEDAYLRLVPFFRAASGGPVLVWRA